VPRGRAADGWGYFMMRDDARFVKGRSGQGLSKL